MSQITCHSCWHFLLPQAFGLGVAPYAMVIWLIRVKSSMRTETMPALLSVACQQKAWLRMDTEEAHQRREIAGEWVTESLGWDWTLGISNWFIFSFAGYETVTSGWDIYPRGTAPSTVQPQGFISKCHHVPTRIVHDSPLTGTIFSAYLIEHSALLKLC